MLSLFQFGEGSDRFLLVQGDRLKELGGVLPEELSSEGENKWRLQHGPGVEEKEAAIAAITRDAGDAFNDIERHGFHILLRERLRLDWKRPVPGTEGSWGCRRTYAEGHQ